MPGVKISALPAVASALTTDFFPVVQAGVTSRETLAQVQTLFGFSGGVLGVPNGGTGLSSTTINQILYSPANNVIAGLPTLASATLVTSVGGVPSLSQTLPTAVQSNITQLGAQSQALNMNTHLINNVVDPVNSQDAATKAYVDAVATGLNVLAAAYAASTVALTVTYANGASGVGATLTNAGALAAFSIDSVSPPLNSRILIKNQASTFQNGIYTVTTVGSGAVAWVLTRAIDYDQVAEINPGDFILVNFGTTNTATAWVETATVATIGTDPILFSQFGAAVTFPITLAQGGTGAALTASNGGIFYSNATTGAILAGTATAGLALLSGASTTPSWSASPPITRVVMQKFIASGTYTPTTGMKYCIIECQAGGGGGGGTSGAAGQVGVGGGGGGGSYGRSIKTAADIGASQVVTIGAGGTLGAAGTNNGGSGGVTSVGTLVTTVAGGGGTGGTSSAASSIGGTPGSGGVGGTSDFTIPGATGIQGVGVSGAAGVGTGSPGGGSFFGSGTNSRGAGTGRDYGSGGSGAFSDASAQAGGAGAPGVVIITEYISI